MSETFIIASPDSDEANSLAGQVVAISEEFVVLIAETAEKLQTFCREYGCAMLLTNYSFYQDNAASISLPEDAIILFQTSPAETEELAGQLGRLVTICDFIPRQISQTLLQQKLLFLLRQRSIIRDHISLQTLHSNLLTKLKNTEYALNLQHHHLDILTERDGLTGLYNRKHLTTVLKNEFHSAREYGKEFCLLLLDIDHFKDINRRYGHLYGDYVLNEIAARLTSNTRSSDLCFRFGGGNFIVLLPNINIQNGCHTAEKLKSCCIAKKFDNGHNNHLITISIGVASIIESSPETPDQLINMADMAMCQAKAEGRNRIKAYPFEDQ